MSGTSSGDGRAAVERHDLTTNERAVLAEARAWIAKEPPPPARALQQVTAVPRRLVRRVMEQDVVAGAIEEGARRLLDQFEPWVEDLEPSDLGLPTSARPDPDVRADALRRADDEAQAVLRKYRGALSLQGGATGAASVNLVATVAAFAADITASTLGLLRAATETLAAYGQTRQLERTAVGVVALAGETEESARRDGLTAAAGLRPASHERSDDLAAALAEQAGARLLNEALETLLRRRVQQRALSAIPLVGAAAGAGLSAWMTTRTCKTAQHVGRLRFLHRHVGVVAADLAA